MKTATAATWAIAPSWCRIISLIMVMPYVSIGGWLTERHRAQAGVDFCAGWTKTYRLMHGRHD